MKNGTPNSSLPSGDKIMYLVAYIIPILSAVFVYIQYGARYRNLRFHSIQSIIYWISVIIIYYILSVILIATWAFSLLGLLSLLWVLAWLFGMYVGYQAVNGVNIEIPIVADIAKTI